MKRFFVPVLLAVSLAGVAAAQDATPPAALDTQAAPAPVALPPEPPAMPALAAMPAQAPQPAPPAMLALQAMLAQAAQPAPPTPPVPPAPMPMDWYAIGKGSYLGIGVQEITAERTRQLKLSEPHGVEVTHVSDDSPAAKAGIKTGDVVLEFNGQRVEGVEQFVRLVRETPPGRSVKLLVDRDGGTQTVTATVGDRKGFLPHMDPKAAQKLAELGAEMQREFGNGSKFQEQMKQEFGQGSQFQKDMEKQFGPDSQFQRDMQKLHEDMKNMHWDFDLGAMTGEHGPKIGVEIEPVGPQLAEFFGVKQGMLVRAVTEGSAAAKAGLKAGDVIVKVAGSDVASPREFTKLLAAGEAGKPVPVTVVRDKREMTMDVTPSTSQARR